MLYEVITIIEAFKSGTTVAKVFIRFGTQGHVVEEIKRYAREHVITSYSIHYTKLYDHRGADAVTRRRRGRISSLPRARCWRPTVPTGSACQKSRTSRG